MFQSVSDKHVVISMSNGVVLEGYLSIVDDEFVKIIEYDNNYVLVRTNDISFVRVITPSCEIPKNESNMPRNESNMPKRKEFCMETPKPSETPYSIPKFERET